VELTLGIYFQHEKSNFLAKKRANAKSILFRPETSKLYFLYKPLNFNTFSCTLFSQRCQQTKTSQKTSRYRNFLPKYAIITAKRDKGTNGKQPFCRESSMSWQKISILRNFLPVAQRSEKLERKRPLKIRGLLKCADWRLLNLE